VREERHVDERRGSRVDERRRRERDAAALAGTGDDDAIGIDRRVLPCHLDRPDGVGDQPTVVVGRRIQDPA